MAFTGRVRLGAILTASLLATGTSHASEQLNMGGSTNTSSFYPYYTAIANAISNHVGDLNVTVVSTGGFARNRVLMMEGELDFGGISPDLIAQAEEEGFDGFRVLWWSLPAIQNIMATRASGFTNIADFDGECFHPGMNGSSGQRNMMRILDALQVRPDLHLSDPQDAINALRNGRCDGQMRATTGPWLDSASAELNLSTALWPVGYNAEQIARIRDVMPWMGFYTMPAGVVDGAPEYTVHAVWIGFAATTAMDEQTAYDVVAGAFSGIEDQRASLSAIADVDLALQTLEVSEYPLHAGAVRYYRQIGLDVPARLLPPEMRP